MKIFRGEERDCSWCSKKVSIFFRWKKCLFFKLNIFVYSSGGSEKLSIASNTDMKQLTNLQKARGNLRFPENFQERRFVVRLYIFHKILHLFQMEKYLNIIKKQFEKNFKLVYAEIITLNIFYGFLHDI